MPILPTGGYIAPIHARARIETNRRIADTILRYAAPDTPAAKGAREMLAEAEMLEGLLNEPS